MLQAVKAMIKANPTTSSEVRARSCRRERRRFRRHLKRLTRRLERPVFVKVGANDGVTGDPCGRMFLDNAKWTGLLIEPVPYCVAKLRSMYKDRNRFTVDPVAVGTSQGTTAFYYVSQSANNALPDLPFWYDQLGSFDRQHILKHFNGRLEPFIVRMDVNVEPLNAILVRHGLTKIDFLHIDAEGYDFEVIRSLDFRVHSPSSILVEHKHLSTDYRNQMRVLLESNGYDVGDAGNDFFAVHREANKSMRGIGQSVRSLSRSIIALLLATVSRRRRARSWDVQS
jgi:FkbM family methyltransferase